MGIVEQVQRIEENKQKIEQEVKEREAFHKKYRFYGDIIRMLLFALVIDFVAFLDVYYGYWFIIFIIAGIIGLGLFFTIRTGIKKGALVCPHCGKVIWSDRKEHCVNCEAQIF